MYKPPLPDTANVSGGAGDDVWASVYPDLILHDSYKQPILLFHEKMAECLRPGKNVAYEQHSSVASQTFAPSLPNLDNLRALVPRLPVLLN